MKKIAIIGSGSWGVALATYLANVGNQVKIWSFSEEERDLINNEKKCKFLPDLIIPENIYCSTSYEEVIKDTEFILHVTPSKFNEVLDMLQETFMSEKMRIYTSNDVKGVELGGALKNIIAFCAGVAAGIGLGDNSFAALITRGLKEISRLGIKLGGELETFYGLSGLGDLIVTCLSEHSRNRKAGKLIGQGKTLEETKKEVGMVIESIDNIDVAYQLGKINNIEMPIVNAVYEVLYNKLDPQEAVKNLMTRDKKME